MRLDALLKPEAGDPESTLKTNAGLEIAGLCMDSRQMQPGDLFIAVAGGQQHGLTYAEQAIAQGAVAVLVDAAVGEAAAKQVEALSKGVVPVIRCPNLQRRLPALAAAFYGHPAERMQVMAVTGTNGKTSTAHWMAQAWHLLGKKAGVLGTLGNGPWEQLYPSTHTTLDAVAIQRVLREMADAGVSHLAMEASSHGLVQQRMQEIPVDWAVFTNLSHDHLDYHGTMQAYVEAKALLFSRPHLKAAVLNLDDPAAAVMRQALDPAVQVVGYGQSATATLRLLNVTPRRQGMQLLLDSPWGRGEVSTQVLGRFNAYNLMAVLSCLLVQGISWSSALALAAQLQPVQGRMQTLRRPNAPLVVVDYAHTPDALEKVLLELRHSAAGRLICVVGCGGNRDTSKRPVMGRLASGLADLCWLTADNPRHESPLDIVQQMMTDLQRPVHVQLDRATAIAEAIAAAAVNDTVLIAGKGHETYQEIAGVRYPFDDVAIATTCLEARACG